MARDIAADELTENGILTAHPDVTMVDYVDIHGEPWEENDDHVIFLDQSGHEWDEWAETFGQAGIDRSEFSEKMHSLARKYTPDDGIDRLGSAYPIVFDAETFEE